MERQWFTDKNIKADQLDEVKFVPVKSLPDHIPWTKELEEYKVILNRMDTRNL